MDLHRLGEVRSRAYHRAIVAKLDDDPAIVTRALARVDAWDEFIRAAITHRMLDQHELLRRLATLPIDQPHRDVIAAKIAHDFTRT